MVLQLFEKGFRFPVSAFLIFMWQLKNISHFNIYENIILYLLKFITTLYQFIYLSTWFSINKHLFKQNLLCWIIWWHILLQINSNYFINMVLHNNRNKTRASVSTREFKWKQKSVLLSNSIHIPSTNEESRFEVVEYFNLYGMRRKCSHLKSLNSSSACEIDYLWKSCRLQFRNT